jgi:phage shock protein PspC (stress-responsive transcriptional regulator)
MSTLTLFAVFLLPVCISIWWSIASERRLMHDELFGLSHPLVRFFVVTRGLYWAFFGILLAAFLAAFLAAGANGAMTRQILLMPHLASYGSIFLDSLADMLARWRFVFVLTSFIMFVFAIVSLFLIGRKALQHMPEEGEPTPAFLKARGRFFFLGLSLMLPPLLLSLFLSF